MKPLRQPSIVEFGRLRPMDAVTAAMLAQGSLPPPAQKTTRLKSWDFAHSLHCSIIGTCLSTAELQKILIRAGLAHEGKNDHDLHNIGVALAARQDAAGKMLNKALDERHHVAIKRYGKAETEEEILALWRQDMKSGDIPGGYWAALTHPAAEKSVVREVFGDIHMLSHLVGAANRADIHWLQMLEEKNAALEEKIQRQQSQLRDAFVSRDAEIRQLRAALRQNLAQAEPADVDHAHMSGLVAALETQMARESQKRVVAEQRLAALRKDVQTARQQAEAAMAQLDALRRELDAAEQALASATMPDAAEEADAGLAGRKLLYVGGRPAQIPHIRRLAENHGSDFAHHDGGVEDSGLILASMVSRADMVLFPVDCVSHSAVNVIKRACKNAGKAFVPLRTSAATSFLAALKA